MSIQTQITRLIQAKSDLIAQIQAKGVTVPADASLDDLAALVAAITGGEDLDEVLGDQDSLIAQIMTALEGKAAGGGVELPELSNPANASDIAAGKEAINADGNVLEGTVAVVDGEYYMEVDLYKSGNDFYAEHFPENDILVRSGSSVIAQWPGSDFGDATAADVAAGKTFTSAAGLKVTGTASAGGGGDSDLPAGYSRADYIQFTGEQIVDSGIVCNQDTKIRVVFTRELSSQHYMFGVASSDNTASVTAYLGGSFRFGDKLSNKTPATNADMIYSCVLSKSEITVTGSKATISGVNDFETVGSVLIGSCRGAAGSVGSPQFKGKMLLWEMLQGDTPVQKLVPLVSTDGVYRFWDAVEKEFHDSITDTPLEGGNL